MYIFYLYDPYLRSKLHVTDAGNMFAAFVQSDQCKKYLTNLNVIVNI